MSEATYQDWDWVLGVNLGGVVNGVVTFVPRIKAHGQGGHVVNTASMAAFVAGPGAGIYTTAKFAVHGLSDALRWSLLPHGIGVSMVCPGLVKSKIYESDLIRPRELSTDVTPADEEFMRILPGLHEAGMDPEEIGEKVLRAIQRNEFYVFTHPDHREELRGIFAEILAAFPDEPVPAERLAVEEAGVPGRLRPWPRGRATASAPSSNALQVPGARCAAPSVVLGRPDTFRYRGSLRPSLAYTSHARNEAASPDGALMEEVAGKTAFVTGGASGIGLGMTEAFAAAEMNVVIADLRPDHIEAALERLAGSGRRESVHAIELDVTDREGFAGAADEAERVFGHVHVLCNNAGMGILGPVARAVRRLGLGSGRPARRRRQRDPDLRAADARSRRGWAHRQHLVDGRGRPDPGGRDLHHGEGRAGGALGGAPQRAGRRRHWRLGLLSRPRADEHPRGWQDPAGALSARHGLRRARAGARGAAELAALDGPARVRRARPRGIRRDDLYIFTHREFREGAEERFQAQLASFPDEPLDEERADAIRFLLSNQIFREVLEHPRG